MSSGPALPWYATFGAAGLAASLAEIATLPIDTAKVRLQLNRSVAGSASSTGLIGTVATIARTEGLLALYKGFWPAIHRQLIFASLRVGLYGQVSTCYSWLHPSVVSISVALMLLHGRRSLRCSRRMRREPCP